MKKVLIIVVLVVGSIYTNSAYAFRVLFVGNSFTRLSIPTLQGLRAASPLGVDVFGYEFVNGTTLLSHSRRKETLDRIANGGWDYVVLQDHSRQTLNHGVSFDLGVRTLVDVIRESGAEPILFMTWARLESSGYPPRQRLVIGAYRRIAAQLNVSVAEVGSVWLDMYDTNRDVFREMFDDDGIHQTKLGSLAIGASIYKVMYDTDLTWSAGPRAIKDSAVRLNQTRPPHINDGSPVTDGLIDPEKKESYLQAILSLLLS